jgi:tetratricopeptide (TPR) repeat protein
VLLVWRARRRGWDRIEVLCLLFFAGTGLAVQKFIGNLAVGAAPFLARDLDEWIRARRWPRWSAAPWTRAALAAGACVAISLPELTRGEPGPGVGIDWSNYPVAACDFMRAEGVRGRGFNHFRLGGYLLWKFWPERERLPFMDIHQAGTPEIRREYLDALLSWPGWGTLDHRFQFDYALLGRPQTPGDHLPDALDADSSWALVFVDDAAALYVKRARPLAAVAGRNAYRVLGAGEERLTRVATAAASDSTVRAAAEAELRRQIAASPACALSHSFLANLLVSEQHYDEARDEIRRALAISPSTPEAHLRLGTILLARGQPLEAIAELRRERGLGRPSAKLELALGLAYQQTGDPARARSAFRRVLARDPSNAAARQLLEQLGRDAGAAP